MPGYYAQRAEYWSASTFKPERQPDLRAMERWLPPMFEGRRVLEIACGTGWWTQHGARRLGWLATDLNPETMGWLAGSRCRRVCGSPPWTRTRSRERATARSTAASPAAGRAMCRWRGWRAGSTLFHTRLDSGAQVVMLDNGFVRPSSTPITGATPKQHVPASHARRRQRARGAEEFPHPRTGAAATRPARGRAGVGRVRALLDARVPALLSTRGATRSAQSPAAWRSSATSSAGRARASRPRRGCRRRAGRSGSGAAA